MIISNIFAVVIVGCVMTNACQAAPTTLYENTPELAGIGFVGEWRSDRNAGEVFEKFSAPNNWTIQTISIYGYDSWIQTLGWHAPGSQNFVQPDYRFIIRSNNSGVPGAVIHQSRSQLIEVEKVKTSQDIYMARIAIELDQAVEISRGEFWLAVTSGDRQYSAPAGMINDPKGDNTFYSYSAGNSVALTPVRGYGDVSFKIFGSVNTVPEPSSLVLGGIALFGLAWVNRRKKYFLGTRNPVSW